MHTRVKQVFPADRHGYLHNPTGGKDIYFHFDDNKRLNGSKVLPGKHNDDKLVHILSTPNRPVQVLQMEECDSCPRALQWRLV